MNVQARQTTLGGGALLSLLETRDYPTCLTSYVEGVVLNRSRLRRLPYLTTISISSALKSTPQKGRTVVLAIVCRSSTSIVLNAELHRMSVRMIGGSSDSCFDGTSFSVSWRINVAMWRI